MAELLALLKVKFFLRKYRIPILYRLKPDEAFWFLPLTFCLLLVEPTHKGKHFFKNEIYFSHVHVLLYGVKFNGEIDIVQFIFTWCVLYSLVKKCLCIKSWKINERDLFANTYFQKSVIYLIKVNYTPYNYTPRNSTWTCLMH